jgi:hypothetical protein
VKRLTPAQGVKLFTSSCDEREGRPHEHAVIDPDVYDIAP